MLAFTIFRNPELRKKLLFTLAIEELSDDEDHRFLAVILDS